MNGLQEKTVSSLKAMDVRHVQNAELHLSARTTTGISYAVPVTTISAGMAMVDLSGEWYLNVLHVDQALWILTNRLVE